MTGRITFTVLAASLALIASFGIAAATTTVVCPSGQTFTIGTAFSGSYSDLCAIDGAKEVAKEALDAGISKLQKSWSFPSVPAGTIVLHYWGTRPANSENDNFQFYYNDTGGAFGQLITGALINKTFAPTDGVRITLETTTQTKNFVVFLADTNENSGTNLDTVNLDCVTIESTP